MAERRTAFWRYFPLHLLVTLGVVGATVGVATAYLKDKYLSQAVSDLESQARVLESVVREGLSLRTQVAIARLCKKIGRFTSTRFTVILPTGEVLGDSEEDLAKMDNHRMRPEVAMA